MVFSVSSPNLTKSEYNFLRVSNPKLAQCYASRFRGGMLALDIMFWPFVLVDAIGGYYTYYSYEPTYCPAPTFDDTKPTVDPWGEPADVASNVKSEKSANKKIEQTVTPQPKKKISTRPIFVAVLESASGGVLKYNEAQFITNVLREEAVRALYSKLNVTIMTRENIIEMLPPDKSLEECEGSCIVETGKNISADYVSQARIGTFGKNLTISVELYRTSNNKLIASFNSKARDIDALEEDIRAKAADMFYEVIREETEK
ncbi:hypothetical protein SAMN05720758_1252 [Fibrobacter sp. UWB11]|nr:hypothetical protein SAMN05720758_1252 [Fibrobacter sp. UWB11]